MDRQTGVKTLPFLILRTRAVIINGTKYFTIVEGADARLTSEEPIGPMEGVCVGGGGALTNHFTKFSKTPQEIKKTWLGGEGPLDLPVSRLIHFM